MSQSSINGLIFISTTQNQISIQKSSFVSSWLKSSCSPLLNSGPVQNVQDTYKALAAGDHQLLKSVSVANTFPTKLPNVKGVLFAASKFLQHIERKKDTKIQQKFDVFACLGNCLSIIRLIQVCYTASDVSFKIF